MDGELNGNGTEEIFSLQTLYNFVQNMLRFTELTKRTLQMECEEAKFALKPWPIETTVVRKIDRTKCICEEGINSGERAEEIAAEIGRTLLHSQQLREKLAANLNKERQTARRPDVREIYTSAFKKPSKETNSNCNVSKEKNQPPRRSLSQQRHSEPRNINSNRFRSTSTVRASNEHSTGRKSVTSKTQVKTSKDNVLAQITGYHKPKSQTNFILANKLSVRGRRSADSCKKVSSKSQVDLRKIGSSSSSKNSGSSTKFAPTTSDKSVSTSIENDEVETLGELDRLIKKFAKEVTLNMKHDCPVHAENAPSEIEEKVVTSVDAVEGLDRFGVPSRLIKVLKTYHSYLKAEVLDKNTAHAKKQQEIADDFLANFKKIGKRKYGPEVDKYQDLVSEYSSMFEDSFQTDVSHHDAKNMKSLFTTLETDYKECQVKNTAGEAKYARSQPDDMTVDLTPDLSNWISNGIWNFACTPLLKDIFGTHVTRYSDRNQLLLFHSLVQSVQRKMYEKQVIELLETTVIPKLKELFDPSSQEFIDVYKLMNTVTQIINPRVPVLAKTDDA